MARTSTIKGKQSVSYRYFSDEGLEALITLPNTVQKLLFKIIKDADKKDNCCQLNSQELIAKHVLNKSNTYTHIRKLKSADFLRDVKDIYGTSRLMVNPEWVSWQSRDLVRFTILMYSLGSHELTIKHLELEDKCRGRINIHTGEHFDWFRSGIESADQHYALSSNMGYEYVSTGDLTPAITPVDSSTNDSSGFRNQLSCTSEESCLMQYDDGEYEASLTYQRLSPAILSMRDIAQALV